MSSSSKTRSKRSPSTKVKKNATKTSNSETKKNTTKKKTATTKTAKTEKTRTVAKSVEKPPTESTLQINNTKVEKTLTTIERLGNQTFALSPFSQYYDDWLINLRQTVTEFEINANVEIDENFTEKREQTLLDIQTTLAKLRIQESVLSEGENTLLKVKQNLEELDADYAKKKHESANKHNINTEQLTIQIKTLENDIATREKAKFSFFQFNAKKAATKKLEQAKQSLKETKNQLETALENFTLEQNKLHDDYIAKKQELKTKSDTLRKETEQLEIDTSIEARKATCTHLNNIISELVKHQTAKSSI